MLNDIERLKTYFRNIYRASIIQQEVTKVGKVNEESVYKPVLIRGADGKFQQITHTFISLILVVDL
jgi:hypothetical protein